MKNQFCYQGKFFDSSGELLKYSREWLLLETDETNFKRIWNECGKGIWMNLCLREMNLTNGDINAVLEKNFLRILRDFFIEQSKKKK